MKKLLAPLFFSSALFCMANIFAQNPPATTPSTATSADRIDPKAAVLMKKFSDTLLKAKNFKFNFNMNVKVTANGMTQESSNNAEFAVERPNKLLYDIKKGMMPMKIISDGKNAYTYIPMAKKYNVEPAEADFDKLKCMDIIKSSASSFIGAFVSDNPYEQLMKGVIEGKYAGFEKLDGKDCHHLSFKSNEIDMDIWVEAGDRPLVRKIIPDMKKQLMKTMDKDFVNNMKHEMVLSFDNWAVSTDLPPDMFKFTPPADAQKITPPEAASKPVNNGVGNTEEVHPSLGKNAPVFKLDLLSGKNFDLSSVKGKKIIVLDFWATWCPPCRMALPILAEVTAAYADKDVVFYAVNLQDDKEKINEFLASEKIKCNVLMDRNAEAARLYNVDGIPQSVIIGKDGLVQAVHVGLLPDLRDQFKQELEDLIAGKSLIK